MSEIAKLYMALGAGGLSFVTVIFLLIYFIKKLGPSLTEIKIESSSYKEIIRNNTEAIKEVGKSNENIAKAIEAMAISHSTVIKLLEKHENRAENIENLVYETRGIARDLKAGVGLVRRQVD